MSFLSSLFGASVKYSRREHPLTETHIRDLMRSLYLPHISKENEIAVAQAILARRRGDGKISLQQIYETLRSMELKHAITLQDRKSFMEVFQNFFRSHFQE